MLINDVLVKKYFYLICLLFGKDVICEYIFYYGLLLLSRYFFTKLLFFVIMNS